MLGGIGVDVPFQRSREFLLSVCFWRQGHVPSCVAEARLRAYRPNPAGELSRERQRGALRVHALRAVPRWKDQPLEKMGRGFGYGSTRSRRNAALQSSNHL